MNMERFSPAPSAAAGCPDCSPLPRLAFIAACICCIHSTSTAAPMAGDEPRGRVADDGGFELRLVDAGRGESGVHGFAREVLHAAVQELPEPGHARADNSNVPHGLLLNGCVRVTRGQYNAIRLAFPG